MATVTNYYEELGISPEMSIEEIGSKLDQLENVWNQRMFNEPEKAAKNLALVSEASSVFADLESKSKYDSSVFAVETPSSGDENQSEAQRWFLQALEFSISKQDDLAKEAISRAVSLCHDNEPNYGEINDRAVHIYINNMDYDSALNCANNAILFDSERIEYYESKASVFWYKRNDMIDDLLAGKQIDHGELSQISEKERDVLNTILQKSREQNEQKKAEDALDKLASSFYWHNPRDVDKAVQYANMAIESMKERLEDHWAIAYDKSQARYIFQDLEEKQKSGNVGVSKASNNLDNSKNTGGGCYVATAVYGSYDCPEVWVLRRFRDNILAGTWYGRAFIHTYYMISPILVKWFGEKSWFKKMWKDKLDVIVKRLVSRGIAFTPYEDKEW